MTEPIRMKDGTMASSVFIPKGTRTVTDLATCNRDTRLWGDDAAVWRPSRWLEPLPRSVLETPLPTVYSYMQVLAEAKKTSDRHSSRSSTGCHSSVVDEHACE